MTCGQTLRILTMTCANAALIQSPRPFACAAMAPSLAQTKRSGE
jgi:hypothetical protein